MTSGVLVRRVGLDANHRTEVDHDVRLGQVVQISTDNVVGHGCRYGRPGDRGPGRGPRQRDLDGIAHATLVMRHHGKTSTRGDVARTVRGRIDGRVDPSPALARTLGTQTEVKVIDPELDVVRRGTVTVARRIVRLVAGQRG